MYKYMSYDIMIIVIVGIVIVYYHDYYTIISARRATLATRPRPDGDGSSARFCII